MGGKVSELLAARRSGSRWVLVPRAFQCLLFAFVTTGAQPAFAGLSARLVYLRSGTAESCPDHAALKKAVARRLGYDPFLLTAPHTIVAEMSGSGAELRARARLLDESGIVLGSRELSGKSSDCAELLASLALAISLTLDPMAAATDPEPEPSDAPEAAKPEPAVPVVAPAPKPTAPPTRPSPVAAPIKTNQATSLSLQAGALGSLGWVPALSPGAELGLVLRHEYLSLGFDVVAVAAQSRFLPNGPGARVSVAYAALAPCIWAGHFGACALGTLGRYAGEGAGVDTPLAGNHLHAAAGARIQTTLPLSAQWGLGVHADGVRVLTRPQFLVAGQEAFLPPAWAANLGIFASWQVL